jgi:AmmeMemoRadiSam system protein B
MNEIADVRPSPIAGAWYSDDPAFLREQINRYLDQASLPPLSEPVTALIAPHAGYRYSGATAGHAFAAVRGETRALVAVISPMHGPHHGSLLTTAHKAYATPLGQVPVDISAVRRLEELLERQGQAVVRVANDHEHALEIELPFLQCALAGEFQLLPVMVRSQSPHTARLLGEALAETLQGRSALLVASTDLSHFFSQRVARNLDDEMLRRIRAMMPDDLFTAEENGEGYACGVGAVAAVLWAAQIMGARRVEVVHQSTSGDITGDTTSVVGYAAAVVL